MKAIEECCPDMLNRITCEEYEQFLHSIQRGYANGCVAPTVCGLTPSEVSLVQAAVDYPQKNGGELITVAQAAAILCISPPAVSRTLKNLEAKGFVQRNVDECDRRTVRISVSETGVQAVSKNIAESLKIVNETLEDFTDEELKTIIRLHCKFTEKMTSIIAKRKSDIKKGTD